VQPIASAGEARSHRCSGSAEAKVAHLKRGVVARGPRAIAGLGKNAAATGGGLRVNSRMQAPAGPLVVRAGAVRRRA